MNTIYDKVFEMRDRNARHRRGVYMQDMTLQMLIERAREELQELEDNPDDAFEMADVMAILWHYCVIQEWTPSEMLAKMLYKLSVRFD